MKALRDAGREVTYVVYPDEGHGWARPENNLDYYGRAEEFLARWLRDPAEQKPTAHMPRIQLDEREVEALAAYLASLRG